ncbi:MAG TPA: hypothetical protein VN578_22290 [Candidatus Binatia bacterium]|jgi:hypothetical protein|nr:hypothetical protein [Candidatus Binatia bacterium]
MSEAILLEALRTSSAAARTLEYDFDFVPATRATKSNLFQLRAGSGYELVATDASGGEFALCDAGALPTRPMLYASSEGQAGVIAISLKIGLSTIIDLPFWQDCLKFSGSGQLAEMRRVAPLAQSDLLADRPQIESSREAVRAIFGLSPLSDPLRELHAALTEISARYPVSGPDGWQFAPLFGKFTAESNAEWRRRLKSQQ